MPSPAPSNLPSVKPSLAPSDEPTMQPSSSSPSEKPSIRPLPKLSYQPSSGPSHPPNIPPLATSTSKGTIYIDENKAICKYNNTKIKILINAAQAVLAKEACYSNNTIIRYCEATILSICGNAIGNDVLRRRLQQGTAKIDYQIASTFLCDVPECTSQDDVSNANKISESISNSVSSAVQSGGFVSSLLSYPDLAGIVDCLVAWGGADTANSASVSTDAGPVVITGARFYPVSSCDSVGV